MTRTQVRPARAASAILMLVALLLLAGRAAAGRPSAAVQGPAGGRSAETLVVRRGDTVWEIARALVGPEGDPRPMVARIREANGLGTGPVPAGMLLRLPAAS